MCWCCWGLIVIGGLYLAGVVWVIFLFKKAPNLDEDHDQDQHYP